MTNRASQATAEAHLGSSLAPKPSGARLVAFLLGVLSGVQLVPLPLNLAVVDPVILLVMVYVLGITMDPSSRESRLIARMLPWLWLICVGSILGTFSAQFPAVALTQVARDIYAFAIFPAVLVWLRRKPHTWRALAGGIITIGAVCAALIIVQGGHRPSGTFGNPNYASHFLALAGLLLVTTRSRITRFWPVLLPLFLAGIVTAASFGALSMIGAAICFGLWQFFDGRPGGVKLVGRSVVVAAIVALIGSGLLQRVSESDEAEAGALGASRFSQTSSTRAEIWRDGLRLIPSRPLGVGPGAVRAENLALHAHELHNDPLAYLVERGAVGLAGLLGLGFVLWRFSPSGGSARLVLVAVAVGSLSRETMNFRHVWIVLALAMAYDTFYVHAPDRGSEKDNKVASNV